MGLDCCMPLPKYISKYGAHSTCNASIKITHGPIYDETTVGTQVCIHTGIPYIKTGVVQYKVVFAIEIHRINTYSSRRKEDLAHKGKKRVYSCRSHCYGRLNRSVILDRHPATTVVALSDAATLHVVCVLSDYLVHGKVTGNKTSNSRYQKVVTKTEKKKTPTLKFPVPDLGTVSSGPAPLLVAEHISGQGTSDKNHDKNINLWGLLLARKDLVKRWCAASASTQCFCHGHRPWPSFC